MIYEDYESIMVRSSPTESFSAEYAVSPTNPSNENITEMGTNPSMDPSPDPGIQFEPFPLDCFPDCVKEFVEAVSASLGCDPAMVAGPALGALAGAIGGTRSLELNESWVEPTAIWLAVIADSGSMKTPAISQILVPFKDFQEIRHHEFLNSLEEFETVKEGPATKPKARQVLLGDVTIQKLVEVLGDNPRGVLCAVDELAGWFSNHTRYSNGGTDLPLWLPAHSGDSILVDRKQGKTIFVRRAVVSLVGGIQPGILKRYLTKDITDSGASARFLFIMPPKKLKVWNDAGVPKAIRASWASLINGLLSLEMVPSFDGLVVPAVIPLDQDALAEWKVFYQDHSKRQHEAEGAWASVLAKLEAQAARFALVLGVADRMAKDQKDLAHLESKWIKAGIRIANWFLRERKRIEAVLTPTNPSLIHLAGRLTDILQKAGPDGLAKSEIHKELGRNSSADEINCALSILKCQGDISLVKVPTNGRPSEVWTWIGG